MSIVDFGRRSTDYARYRPGFPASFYSRLERFVQLAGCDAVDLGTGPGVVALELAARGARVVGVDVAAAQVAEATRLAGERGVGARAAFRVAQAEATGLTGASFDLVLACQCWVWLDHAAAMHEAQRLLKPGGLFVVAHFNYLPAQSDVARATEELVLKWNPTWSMSNHDGVYPHLMDDMARAGFDDVEQFAYDHRQLFTRESWRGRIRTCNGVGSGALSEAEVEAFDSELATVLSARFPAEPFAVPHRVWVVLGRSNGRASV